MSNGEVTNLKHLILNLLPQKEPFRSPKVGRSKKLNLALRDREVHANKLIEQLDEIRNKKEELYALRNEFGYKGDYGIFVEFESEPNYELKIESLERLKSGIELENVRVLNNTTYATVWRYGK